MKLYGIRVKVKNIHGTWRVILPVTCKNWLEIARTPYATPGEARTAAKQWARLLAKEAA